MLPVIFDNEALAGKRILVTGGGTGLGKAISEGLLRQGAEVYISGRREEILQEAVEALREVLDMDVTHGAAIAGLEQVLSSTIGEDGSGEVPDGLLDSLENAYQSAQNSAGLANITRVRLRDAEGPDRMSLLQNLGSLVDQGGGTPAEALEAWGSLLALDADSGQALERVLARRFEEGARYARAITFLDPGGVGHVSGSTWPRRAP